MNQARQLSVHGLVACMVEMQKVSLVGSLHTPIGARNNGSSIEESHVLACQVRECSIAILNSLIHRWRPEGHPDEGHITSRDDGCDDDVRICRARAGDKLLEVILAVCHNLAFPSREEGNGLEIIDAHLDHDDIWLQVCHMLLKTAEDLGCGLAADSTVDHLDRWKVQWTQPSSSRITNDDNSWLGSTGWKALRVG